MIAGLDSVKKVVPLGKTLSCEVDLGADQQLSRRCRTLRAAKTCFGDERYSVVIKSLLVLRIAAQKPNLYQRDIEKAVNAILDEIVAAMARGDRVELRDFGAFVVKVRAARIGRNPKTGSQVHVPAKVTPAFKPGKEIRKRLMAR